MKACLATIAGMAFACAAFAGPVPAPVSDADFPDFPAPQVDLGRDLFFDPILSGNRNIACATCHHPTLGTSDAMSLSIGEGGIGLGRHRHIGTDNVPHARIPRNAPAMFNLGAYEFTVMFHDGRVARDPEAMYGIRMPPGRTLEKAVPSPLAAQAILPLLAPEEMSGQPGENPVADAVAAGRIHGTDGAWELLTTRVAQIDAYRQRFADIGVETLHITDIGNALAAYATVEFRATNSPFDQFLRGEAQLSAPQLAGMDLFYGKARCSTCHSGKFQTDHDFHAIGMPQLGPGKGTSLAYADTGRGMVTGAPLDTYRFRTPSLRNVALTAPYGHSGAYGRLEDAVRHHLDAMTALTSYDRSLARLAGDMDGSGDWMAMNDQEELMRIAQAIEISDVTLTDSEIAMVMAFLNALTDSTPGAAGLGIPDVVPSGLPLDLLDDHS